MAAAGIRAITNRITAAAVRGFRAIIRIPTKKLAESTVTLLSGKTLPGMAVTTGTLPFHQAGRRTILMGEDMAEARRLITSKVESGFYDVVIHGDDLGFGILVKTVPHPDPTKVRQVWREVSVREVADLIRPHLKPGDQIRLLACKTGGHGGPAQQLANELNHTVWAPNKSLSVEQGVFKKVNGEYTRVPNTTFSKKTYVPFEGGKFYSFEPQPHRGAATLAGKSGKVPGNVAKGEINPAR